MGESAAVVVEGLSYRYGRAGPLALDGVSFRVAPGEKVGLLGQNGAGKSTLVRILCGVLPTTAADLGRARLELAGFDLHEDSLQARRRLGYLPEHAPLHLELRVSEYLRFRGELKGLFGARLRSETQRVLEVCDLGDRREVPIGRLSRGYRQRVGIADALLGSPEVVVLDEPSTGLDPVQAEALLERLRGLLPSQALIVSSHVLREVERLCDRVLILRAGRIVADEPMGAALATDRVRVSLVGTAEEVTAMLGRVFEAMPRRGHPPGHPPGFEGRPSEVAGEVQAVVSCGDHSSHEVCAAIGREAARAGLPVVLLEAARRRLEERFIEALDLPGGGNAS